jgi:ribosomal protein S27AE
MIILGCGGEDMKTEKIIPICPKCGSKEMRARILKDELYCRRCGYVGKREEFFLNFIK